MRTRIPLLVLCGALVLADSANAADAFHITGAFANPKHPLVVDVTFSEPLAKQGPHADVKNVRLKDANGVVATAVTLSLLPLSKLALPPTIMVTLSAVPPANAQICFDHVAYVHADQVVATTAEICSTISADVATVKAAALKALTDIPVAPDEKTLNASGFVTKASDSSEGGADIAFNPTFSDPNASAFFRLKKSTADKGDAKQLEIGAAYRAGIPWNIQQLRELRDTTDPQKITDLVHQRQRSLISGSVINFAMKLEAEPTSFNATNGVGEAHYEILTMTKPLPGKQGFWSGYVIPVGAEVGRKLGVDEKGSPTTDHLWIARYKAGGGLKFFYKAGAASVIPISRVELSADGIWRYLGVDELSYNSTTKAIDRTTHGSHAYAQIALKAFFIETPSGRFGVKLACNRGSLPPVFAAVKSVDFGFIVESADKDQKP